MKVPRLQFRKIYRKRRSDLSYWAEYNEIYKTKNFPKFPLDFLQTCAILYVDSEICSSLSLPAALPLGAG